MVRRDFKTNVVRAGRHVWVSGTTATADAGGIVGAEDVDLSPVVFIECVMINPSNHDCSN
jgi:hypothetical protein